MSLTLKFSQENLCLHFRLIERVIAALVQISLCTAVQILTFSDWHIRSCDLTAEVVHSLTWHWENAAKIFQTSCASIRVSERNAKRSSHPARRSTTAYAARRHTSFIKSVFTERWRWSRNQRQEFGRCLRRTMWSSRNQCEVFYRSTDTCTPLSRRYPNSQGSQRSRRGLFLLQCILPLFLRFSTQSSETRRRIPEFKWNI